MVGVEVVRKFMEVEDEFACLHRGRFVLECVACESAYRSLDLVREDNGN